MKTLDKTKVLFCLITVITLTVIFVACKKDNEFTEPKTSPTTQNLEITYIVDGETNIISQSKSYPEFHEWKQKNNNQKDGSLVMVGNIAFDLTSLPTLTILSKTNNSLTFEMDYATFTFTDTPTYNRSNNTSLKIETESGREITFNATGDSNYTFTSFLSNLNPGDNVSIELINGEYVWYNQTTLKAVPLAPYIIFGVACIIAKIIDAYCNDLVEEAVAECTRQGRCSIIGAEHCSVTCIDPKPQR